jgi:hypothetical protein
MQDHEVIIPMNDLAADYDKLAYGSGTEFLVFAGFSAQRRTEIPEISAERV